MSLLNRVKAAMKVEATDVSGVLDLANTVAQAMTTNVAIFDDPDPTMVVYKGQITSLVASEANMHGSGVHDTTVRDADLRTVYLSTESLKNYAQSKADLSPTDAVTIIKSSGFPIAAGKVFTKPLLALKPTSVATTIHAVANATTLRNGSKKRSFFLFQVSLDGGHTWQQPLTNGYAYVDITNLPLNVDILVQVAINLGGVQEPWSPAVPYHTHP